MQRMIVKEILSPKDRDRRAKQYQDWLDEHGYTTSLDAHSDTQELTEMIHQLNAINAATERLHAQIQHLINQKTPRWTKHYNQLAY